ncbi:aspartate kinase [Anaerobacillus isosaccharinicus]|uniref:Aspartokinase n=1 Tax=Anaerobacillus isosaccharinicus TaxID=1532552 RepID=A0A1S2MEX4_9BACI|nr:aspartate kinase [Anaerobacillus isosaccharinicus]MBA5585683.1 aspartate kinase [Anaerobacillus isosaccharinicus]QOY36011.1 aspartate kinase [Anaerobacillus isosaccharinicus]
MKVCKFGGTSLASAEQMQKVASIVMADPERKIVVVSAPGKRFKEDTKVTDLLISLADAALSNGDVKEALRLVVSRYEQIALELKLSSSIVSIIEDDLLSRLGTKDEGEREFIDLMKASGEDNNAKLFSFYMQSLGVNAHFVDPKDVGLVLSKEYGNAQVLPEAYENLYKELRNKDGVLIFPGFFGYTQEGTLVTFPRGGSDITGSIVAAAVQADLYENFTDVDSVFAANPNVVQNPMEIEELTYREMRELSYAGFSVFHDEALIPAFKKGVPVCIKNTNNPSARGTMVVNERNYLINPVIGIASDSGFSTIYVRKYLMNREIGFGRRLLEIIEDEGLSYEHMPSGIDDTSVILKGAQLTLEIEARIVDRIEKELDADDVHVEHDFAMVMVVGEGMKKMVGITAKATTGLARAGVNLHMINQGSSEVSMVFGVKATDADKAVRELYNDFFVATKTPVL